MERLKSLGNWLIIILILVVTAVIAVVWPLVTQSLNFSSGGSFFGGPTRPRTSPAPIVIPIPEPIASGLGSNELVLSGFIAFAALLAVVVGSVVVVGIIITILMRLGGKFTGQVEVSEEYQQHVATLNNKAKEELKEQREQQPVTPVPDGYIYGLDAVSFSLLILFFVALIGSLIYALVSPTGEITMFGQTFYSGLPILIILFVITIPILYWLIRRNRLQTVADKDYAPIPWDFIVVMITGLLVVGVGIGLMLFLNSPA